MKLLPKSVEKAIEEFSKLPGIGPKSASRLVFHLIRQHQSSSQLLGDALNNLHNSLIFCSQCFNIADADPCPVCADQSRDSNVICVVEQPLDAVALERTEFNGRYHILGGSISPIDGIGPDNLNIKPLFRRLKDNPGVSELIIATNPTMEGEATALYLQQQLNELGLKPKVTRIAHGLPVGGDLEYADAVTLTRAIEGRQTLV